MTYTALQLQQLCWYLISRGYSLVRGRATYLPKELRVIAVLAAGQMGDVVCTTPVFRAVRNAYPDVRLIVDAGTGPTCELLAHSELADEYRDFRVSIKSIRWLRRARIDAAVLTGANFSVLIALYLAGVPLIVAPLAEGGACPQETRLYSRLARLVVTRPYRFGHYAPAERLHLLEPLGIYFADTSTHLAYSAGAGEAAQTILAQAGISPGKFVCISVGAGNKVKQWPPARFVEVARHIYAAHALPLVLIGTALEREEVASFVGELPTDVPLLNLSERLSLDMLKAVIAQAALFISVDTGPLYIAAAFGVATVDIVGPMDEREQPPQGKRHSVVTPPCERVPQLHILNARIYNEEEALRQSLAISSEQVTSAVDTLLTDLTCA